MPKNSTGEKRKRTYIFTKKKIKMDNDTLYDDSPVTKKFLEKCLQDHLHSKATLAKCRATVISKGMGFTSEVTRVWLRWSPEATATDINLPEKVIVKAPTIQCFDSLLDKAMTNDEQKSTMDSGSIVEMMHKIECDAYKILYRADPRPVPLPLIYSIREKNPSLIIMEDLEDRAGIIPTIAIG
uniref:Uncharacterized protein n=1 Tax=Romanomermis culicivorax TaxID=13658 RepID=A0A915JYV1_ROMCU